MIPDSPFFFQPTLCSLLEHDALVQRSRLSFALLDWSALEERQVS
jgi:hypothetical protein